MLTAFSQREIVRIVNPGSADGRDVRRGGLEVALVDEAIGAAGVSRSRIALARRASALGERRTLGRVRAESREAPDPWSRKKTIGATAPRRARGTPHAASAATTTIPPSALRIRRCSAPCT